MTIEQIINRIYPIGSASIEKLKQLIEEVSLPKKHLLMTTEKRQPDFYFIKKGIARAYAYKDGYPVTFWFGTEGDAIISAKSYIKDERSYENIELLEDTDLYKLNTKMLTSLYMTDINAANWGRKFMEEEFIKTEQRLISMQFQTATQRYADLLQNYPGLLQRVPLGYIASYLGVSQVSLSRIRKSI